jgi:hypothetical protein
MKGRKGEREKGRKGDGVKGRWGEEETVLLSVKLKLSGEYWNWNPLP